jgi:WD40 repeat protein
VVLHAAGGVTAANDCLGAGDVTALEFVASTHLLSGGADNTICIWRCSDWVCLHKMGGHKAAITSLSAHLSGRIALSTANDRTLRLWDLVKGRMSFVHRLPANGSKVLWSPAADMCVAPPCALCVCACVCVCVCVCICVCACVCVCVCV